MRVIKTEGFGTRGEDDSYHADTDGLMDFARYAKIGKGQIS